MINEKKMHIENQGFCYDLSFFFSSPKDESYIRFIETFATGQNEPSETL